MNKVQLLDSKSYDFGELKTKKAIKLKPLTERILPPEKQKTY